ncbi:MAG: aldo/keto reductase, partial [Clostridiales bacterium]|nr:aldo/keto reductase [Clostridiales bacterium]
PAGYDEIKRMVDAFMAAGFNYFDTAHGYLEGNSEIAVRECLAKRYPRESYVLTNKLTSDYFNRQEDIRPFLLRQLAACGVEYFDFYLMHAQNAGNYDKFQACRAYETAFALKKEGLVRHVGFSFHDNAQMLERILNDHPEVEAVQLQFNYVDYLDAGVQSKACYEVCRKYGKPVIVMEPVKGGTLVNLPAEAQKIIDGMGGGSAASYAIRFAASFEGIMTVLSGMGNMAQLNENIGFMQNFTPLSEKEFASLERVTDVFCNQHLIPCTACRYCTEGCPKKISIPDLFADMNAKKLYNDWNSDYYYSVHTANRGKASDCIACGKCEKSCPQHLSIRKLLGEVAEQFERGQ